MHMKHNGATRTLLQLIDGVFPIFDLYTVYIDAAATTKRPLLSPGAAHNHRAATERPPESSDEIGCAARSGGRSGWRPFMMNGEEDGTPSSTAKMSADHWSKTFCPENRSALPPIRTKTSEKKRDFRGGFSTNRWYECSGTNFCLILRRKKILFC
jgi:hypothetical protein